MCLPVVTIGYNVYVNNEKVNPDLITETSCDIAGLETGIFYNLTVATVTRNAQNRIRLESQPPELNSYTRFCNCGYVYLQYCIHCNFRCCGTVFSRILLLFKRRFLPVDYCCGYRRVRHRCSCSDPR